MNDQGKEIARQAEDFNIAGNYVEAEKLYDLLLTQNHDNPHVLATLGTMYIKMGRNGLAISLLERASKAPKVSNVSDIYCNLAIAYKLSHQTDKCEVFFKKAIEKDPSAQALANYGALLVGVGNPDAAIKIATRALDIDPQCAIGHWNLSQALLEKGEWPTAWDEHEWGFKCNPQMRVDRFPNLPKWDGTKDKTVVVWGEQGIGDEIMFASMLPDMIEENTVIFECHPRLKTLFEHSFPGLTCIGTREDTKLTWPEEYDIDSAIAIGSLGKFYRRTKESFPGTPYLKAEPAPKSHKFRVGISWTGGLKAGRVLLRTVPLSWWKEILNVPDVEFVSLQYTECEAEIDLIEGLGYEIKQFPEIKAQDYYETAKLVKSCDLVISCCTSVIHLAGALGVPCWVMVPNKPAWRYGVTGRMSWYRSVRLYRQPEGDSGAWRPVIDKVALDLSEMLKRQEAA